MAVATWWSARVGRWALPDAGCRHTAYRSLTEWHEMAFVVSNSVP